MRLSAMSKKIVGASACLALAAAVGCGGGSQSATAPFPTALAAMGYAQIAIKFPGTSGTSAQAAGRYAKYLSPAVMSAVITLNGTSTTLGPATGKNNCTTGSNGVQTCTITLPAPVGTYPITATTWDGTSGNGNQLGVANLTATITAGQTTPVTVTFNGIVASVNILLEGNAPGTTPIAPCLFAPGTNATCQVIVDAKDADGFHIMPPGSFTTPITINNTDASGATTLSATTATAPQQPISLTYNGSNAVKSLTISAAAPGIPPSNVVPVTVVVGATPAPTASASVTPAPSPSPRPVPASSGLPTPVALGTASSSGFELFSFGNVNTSSGVYTQQGASCPSTSGSYLPSTTVAPSPSASPSASASAGSSPSPLPSGQYTIYFGTYAMSTGDSGIIYFFYNALPFSQTAPATPVPPGGNAVIFGLSNGLAVASQTQNVQIQPAGTPICTLFSLSVNPSSGSGTIVVSTGASGTMSFNSVRSFPNGVFPRLPESIRRLIR